MLVGVWQCAVSTRLTHNILPLPMQTVAGLTAIATQAGQGAQSSITSAPSSEVRLRCKDVNAADECPPGLL